MTRYDQSIQGLTRDLRRFGLVNAVVLGLLIGLVLQRQWTGWRIMAFSTLLTGYTGWATYNYVYNQDWAWVILQQDWAAPSYQATMIVIALILADWLFLNGRITDFVWNMIVSALSNLSPG